MPRLDWRLWFEALAWEGATSPPRPYQPSDWFASFLERLREGEPKVVGLLAFDPFEGRAPTEAELTRLHEEAHARCYIANSLKTEVVVESPAPE